MNHDRIQMPNEEEASDITGRYDAAHLAAEKAVVPFTRYNFFFCSVSEKGWTKPLMQPLCARGVFVKQFYSAWAFKPVTQNISLCVSPASAALLPRCKDFTPLLMTHPNTQIHFPNFSPPFSSSTWEHFDKTSPSAWHTYKRSDRSPQDAGWWQTTRQTLEEKRLTKWVCFSLAAWRQFVEILRKEAIVSQIITSDSFVWTNSKGELLWWVLLKTK